VDSLDSDTRADWVALCLLACSCFTSHPLLYHPFLESLPGIENVLKKIGLSETTWEDAKEKYLKLAMRGI